MKNVQFYLLHWFSSPQKNYAKTNKQISYTLTPRLIGIDTARKCQGKQREEIFNMLKRTYMVVVCMFLGERISASKVT